MRRMRGPGGPYHADCRTCGRSTTKQYAREHDGQCKECTTGESGRSSDRLFTCPDCGEKRLSAYQKQHGYHCDTCTHNVETSGGIYGF